MSDFFDRLELELRGAVTAPGDAVPPPRRSWGAGLMIGAGSFAAVVVAVLAIALPGHGGHGGAQRRATSPGAACTQKLLAELGVLRRPQTAADRAFTPPSNPGGRTSSGASTGNGLTAPASTGTAGTAEWTLAPKLTRLARVLGDGEHLYFAVYAPVAGSLTDPFGDMVQLYAVKPATGAATLDGGVLSAFALRAAYQQPPMIVSGYDFSVVPDGVARVVWTFPRVSTPSFREPGGKVIPARVIPASTATATVAGNIAAASVPHFAGFAATATWLAADGHVLGRARFGPSSVHVHFSTGRTITAKGTMTGTPIPAGC